MPAAARGFAASVLRVATLSQSRNSLLDRSLPGASSDAARQALQQSCRHPRLPRSATPRMTHATSQPAPSTPAALPAKPPVPAPPTQPPPPPSRPAPPQRSLWERTREAAAVPARALRAVADAGARAASAVAASGPEPVRRLADSVRSGTGQRVLSLQLEAFWQQHRNKVFVLGGVAVVYILWCAGFSTGFEEHKALFRAPDGTLELDHPYSNTAVKINVCSARRAQIGPLQSIGVSLMKRSIQIPHTRSEDPCGHAYRKSLFGVASIFVNLSETMAELGFLVILFDAVPLVTVLLTSLRLLGCAGSDADTACVHCN